MNAPNSRRSWQLPAGIDEALPEAAAHLEQLRRRLLDCAARWGYRLVIPPMLEYTDSLLVGVGEDLDLLTFKMPDQLSGRMLGLRADMTPQVARIDAHSLGGSGINRLCYAGSTLHTRARSLTSSRSPLQLGAELYGDSSASADLEVIDLMLSMLAEAGIARSDLTLDLGHGGLFKPLLAAAGVDDRDLRSRIFDAMQRKSVPDLEQCLEALDADAAELLRSLLDLYGGTEVLAAAREKFAGLPEAEAALAEVEDLAAGLARRHGGLSIHIDLAELRGFNYHTGVVFAAYLPGFGEALARGGRYDNVGAVYGKARPATGFATDLRVLAAQLLPAPSGEGAISAPDLDDAELLAAIRELRDAGETVIVALGGRRDARCGRFLELIDGRWQLLPGLAQESE
ncbi:MAG: ATP phosphoribosyltransferase regulatory subunit [Halieaceae bacterium]|nr:ATP phosphoribosyltransferase regulatory subunit [Halieaceae bacterium]